MNQETQIAKILNQIQKPEWEEIPEGERIEEEDYLYRAMIVITVGITTTSGNRGRHSLYSSSVITGLEAFKAISLEACKAARFEGMKKALGALFKKAMAGKTDILGLGRVKCQKIVFLSQKQH